MAAGPWYSGSGIGDANIAVAARTIQIALDESVKNKEIMGHPVMLDLMARDTGLGQLMGELGVSISLATVGTGKLAAKAEGTEATPTNWTVANSATVSPARRAWARDVSDYASSLQNSLLTGELSPNEIAVMTLDGLGAWVNDIVDRMAALFASATYEIGTTGTALTWSPLNEGVVAFKNRGAGRGPGLGLISAKGVNDLNSDSLSLGGGFQFSPEAAAGISRLQDGAFVGSRNGIDWYLNSELDADGADTLGGVISNGSFLMKHQRVALPSNADMVLDAGWYTQEMRRPGGGINRVETVSYNAIGILEQSRYAAVRYKTA